MQPESNEISNSNFTSESRDELSNLLHDGSRADEPSRVSPPQRHEERLGGLISVDAARTTALDVASISGRERVETMPLRDVASSRDRVSEHERALSQSVTPRDSSPPVFDVRKRVWTADDKHSPIGDLPNELLVHAISHLSPLDLASVALVSHRFHDLVTSQHAWQLAFARYFPGGESVVQADTPSGAAAEGSFRSDRRFTRLSTSWRSEYIVRTRLLRSLARGKPLLQTVSTTNARAGHVPPPTSTVVYNSHLVTTVNYMHATFGTSLNKKFPKLVHGADEFGCATSSDPSTGKTDSWGSQDPAVFLQFADGFPGEAQWGLGPGQIVANPNVMDVSQMHGMLVGQGVPGGSMYYRAIDEMRGNALQGSTGLRNLSMGIPKLDPRIESICSVWLAKSNAVLHMTDGLVGILVGSSGGIVSAYSLGTDGMRATRIARRELTARWVISPGVPIIAIAVDDSYAISRRAQNRIWAVVLNALGEVFYLTQLPRRASLPTSRSRIDEAALESQAWDTGRTVQWTLAESSRRQARPDPYREASFDGSYSPRSSWSGMCLSKEQVAAETAEIETFLAFKPRDIQKRCSGWDMRRKLLVDFAGDDGNYAGESVVVFGCGVDEETTVTVTRHTRCRFPQAGHSTHHSMALSEETPFSLFGSNINRPDNDITAGLQSPADQLHEVKQPRLDEEWRESHFRIVGFPTFSITAVAMDESEPAIMTQNEALRTGNSSAGSSPWASPTIEPHQYDNPKDSPGHGARFFGAGTSTGIVILWDVRASFPQSASHATSIEPLRVIYTGSPEISCLAMTALYVVHGGNDGLVQAWDVLASSLTPIRTLNSRFSSRARRRLVQAQASARGVGINLFSAGAIVLDPDPTSLRGVVSLGCHLKYWAFQSTGAEQAKSGKRRLRRSERGSNSAPAGSTYAGAGRGNIKDWIASERMDMRLEQEAQRKQNNRLAGRFGIGLLSNEDEAMAYAALLSQESLAADELKRRMSGATSVAGFATPSRASSVAGGAVLTGTSGTPAAELDDQLSADIAEAIRQSLEEPNSAASTPSRGDAGPASLQGYVPAVGSAFDFAIRTAKPRRSSPPLRRGVSGRQGRFAGAESSEARENADLDFALQLSLAEQDSLKVSGVNRTVEGGAAGDAVGHAGGEGKGKGKERE